MIPDFPPLLKIGDERLKNWLVKIEKNFERKYVTKPDFYLRVPGRVNLIGEHVDYNGYSVCPMAIQQCVTMAVKKIGKPQILISNENNNQYEDFSGDMENFKIENEKPVWYNYLLCGIKGALDGVPANRNFGLILHIDSSIPISSGLSSSSALVCASALATCVVTNMIVSKIELAELTAKAERYIGTEGGGMDQAIILNGEAGEK